MSDVLVDSKLVFSNLVEASTGEKIAIDIAHFTLPQRYELYKMGKEISDLSSKSAKLYKERQARFKPDLRLV